MDIGATFFQRLPIELILYLVVAGVAQALQLQSSLMNARLHALELQLQPHFLFNTLNTISSLVRTEQNEEAVTMIAGLSDLLRYTLDHAGRQQVTLDEESTMLRRYLEIQKGRFPDRLTYSIDVAPEVRHAAVPTFILQPLAENAIRHGIAHSAGAGVVTVRAFRDGARVQIEMFNSGTLQPPANDGIGVANTRERLRQLYGNDQHFDLRERSGGVLASLSVPMKELE
jgi:two-component system sensor histidine kinase AlgZ